MSTACVTASRTLNLGPLTRAGCQLAITLLLACQPAWPQSSQEKVATAPQGDLTQVSIETLMNMEVTSVSKKEQKMSQVAAAIFVITQGDIRRSGATNIPDLLRMVPGLDVAQINGSTWAISARGFNLQVANKLKPRADIAHVLPLICATSNPGTMSNRSGMFVAPERRMSPWVMTKIAAATWDIFCSFLETEVTSMFIRVSILTCVRSPCGAVGTFAEEACGHAGWQASKSVITSWHPARVSRRRFKVRL